MGSKYLKELLMVPDEKHYVGEGGRGGRGTVAFIMGRYHSDYYLRR